MALQNVLGKFLYWPQTSVSQGTPFMGYVTLDANDEYIAAVFQIPKTGSLTEIAFSVRTVTSADTDFSVRIETVSTTTGLPSGTLIDANAYGTVNIGTGDSNTIKTCTLTGAVSVTVGTIVAVVFKLTGTGPNLQLWGGYPQYESQFPYYYSSPDASIAPRSPNLALNIGGWVSAYQMFCQAVTYESIAQASSNNKERGILINLPFKARVCGAVASCTTPTGSTYKISLYSTPTGTPVEEATTIELDGDVTALGRGGRHHLFSSPFILQPNTNYVLALQVTGTTAIDVYYLSYPSNTYSAAYPGGASAVWYARDSIGSTSFSATDTRVPIMHAIIDQLDDGAGFPHFGDMTGGLK